MAGLETNLRAIAGQARAAGIDVTLLTVPRPARPGLARRVLLWSDDLPGLVEAANAAHPRAGRPRHRGARRRRRARRPARRAASRRSRRRRGAFHARGLHAPERPAGGDLRRMIFSDGVFFVFFGVFFALYLATARSLRLQNVLILVASYVFYGWWDPRFLMLIAASTAMDYVAGLAIAGRRTGRAEFAAPRAADRRPDGRSWRGSAWRICRWCSPSARASPSFWPRSRRWRGPGARRRARGASWSPRSSSTSVCSGFSSISTSSPTASPISRGSSAGIRDS